MDFVKIFKSKTFKIVLSAIAGLIIVLLILALGMFIGYRKANFSYRWGENYHKNFGGPRGGFFQDFSGRDFIEGHGTFGQIIKIDGQTLVTKGQDGVEKIILIKDDTAIKRSREDIKLADLKINDYIVTIGEPNDAGQIEAKLIRIMPSMPPASPLPPAPPMPR
jgi:hypothetical protein